MEQPVLLQTSAAKAASKSQETPEAGPSPFIPGTKVQFALDSTSLGWFKTCPRLYYYNMICGYRQRDESVHLRFGIEYHRALQNYDISRAKGLNHADAEFDVVRQMLVDTYGWNTDHKYKNRDILVRSVIWYLEKYAAGDPAETHLLPDGKPAVEVSFRFELDWGPMCGEGRPYLLCGHLDRVVKFNDDLFVMDRKTTTITPGSYYFDQYEPNNQMTLYILASQVILHTHVKGVIIDAAQIAIEFNRFTRGFTFRTQDQIEEWLVDLREWTEKMEDHAVKDYWPMNDTACDKYGGCRFRGICSKSPSVRDVFLRSEFETGNPWNPLIIRE